MRHESDRVDVVAYNKQAWNAQVRAGNPWTIPVSDAEVERARSGDWQVVLTPTKPVPPSWFPPLQGIRVLGLASGGGQQGPILAAAGASVTIVDNSPEQLQRDRELSRRHNLSMTLIEGDMADLSMLDSQSFDLIFHPCSNCFVAEVEPVWREAFRVLKPGATMLSGLVNPVVFTLDLTLERQGIAQMKYSIPYSDLEHRHDPEVAQMLAQQEPLSFGHTLEDQLGGQMQAGFYLTGLYEDNWPADKSPVHAFLNCYLATRALKPRTS